MKKISLLLIFITLFSACNKEIEDSTIEDNNIISAPSSSMTQRNFSTNSASSTNNNFSTTALSSEKIQIYTYAIGLMFESYFQETTSTIEAYSYTNSTGQQVVNLKELLTGDFMFKTRFIYSLQELPLNNFGVQSMSMHPPVPPVVNGVNLTPYYQISEELLADLYSIFNDNIQDNIEIYIARPIITNTIHIAPHPLENTNSSNGYIFNEGAVANNAAVFDTTFLNNHTENVLIVRPYRDVAHPYNYIPVNDFTTFYN